MVNPVGELTCDPSARPLTGDSAHTCCSSTRCGYCDVCPGSRPTGTACRTTHTQNDPDGEHEKHLNYTPFQLFRTSNFPLKEVPLMTRDPGLPGTRWDLDA